MLAASLGARHGLHTVDGGPSVPSIKEAAGSVAQWAPCKGAGWCGHS